MKSLKLKISTALTALVVGLSGVNMNSANAGGGEGDGGKYSRKVVYVNRSTGVKVKVKEKGYYDLNGWKHVTKLKVKVKTPNAKFKMVANGIDYYPVYVGGVDPHYVFTLNQAISNFELFNDGIEDCLLDGIFLDAVDHLIASAVGGSFFGSMPTQEVREIIQAIDALAYYVTLEENQQFLQPIKVMAGRALSVSLGRGDFSMKTSAAILAMIAQIEFSREFFEQRMTVDATYNWTVLLLAHKERLSDMID